MSVEAVDTRETGNILDRIAQVVRSGADLLPPADALKSWTDDGVRSARRAVKAARYGAEQLQELKADAMRYVKRQPVQAVTIAAAAGFLVGVTSAYIAQRAIAGPRTS